MIIISVWKHTNQTTGYDSWKKTKEKKKKSGQADQKTQIN